MFTGLYPSRRHAPRQSFTSVCPSTGSVSEMQKNWRDSAPSRSEGSTPRSAAARQVLPWLWVPKNSPAADEEDRPSPARGKEPARIQGYEDVESDAVTPLQVPAAKRSGKVRALEPEVLPRDHRIRSLGGISGTPGLGDPDPRQPPAPLPGQPQKPPSPAPPPARLHSPTWLLLRGSAAAASAPSWPRL